MTKHILTTTFYLLIIVFIIHVFCTYIFKSCILNKNKTWGYKEGLTGDSSEKSVAKQEFIERLEIYESKINDIYSIQEKIIDTHGATNPKLLNNEIFINLNNEFNDIIKNLYTDDDLVTTDALQNRLDLISNISEAIKVNIKKFNANYDINYLTTGEKIKQEINILTLLENKFNNFSKISKEFINFNCIDGMNCYSNIERDIEVKKIEELESKVGLLETNKIVLKKQYDDLKISNSINKEEITNLTNKLKGCNESTQGKQMVIDSLKSQGNN
jgi:hypothetical protein